MCYCNAFLRENQEKLNKKDRALPGLFCLINN